MNLIGSNSSPRCLQAGTAKDGSRGPTAKLALTILSRQKNMSGFGRGLLYGGTQKFLRLEISLNLSPTLIWLLFRCTCRDGQAMGWLLQLVPYTETLAKQSVLTSIHHSVSSALIWAIPPTTFHSALCLWHLYECWVCSNFQEGSMQFPLKALNPYKYKKTHIIVTSSLLLPLIYMAVGLIPLLTTVNGYWEMLGDENPSHASS